MSDETNSIGVAAAVLADLRERLRNAEIRRGDMAKERQGIAFAAHTEGGDARKRLDKINRAAGELDSEVSSLGSAIAEAEKRVNAAITAEKIAQRLQNAEAARSKIPGFREAGLRLEAAIEEVARSAQALFDIRYEIRGLGIRVPDLARMRLAVIRAMETRFTGMNMGTQYIAPSEKHDAQYYVDAWIESFSASIDGFVKDAHEDEEEALRPAQDPIFSFLDGADEGFEIREVGGR